ncbi:MAG: hypothetical protein K0B15_08145 [Lentimicrobium sp.]|nr:hypothetical protein [Lentimicrobium sp.]
MDDYLYIIIGILWVVYSLYNNKQKQQKKRLLEEQRRNQPFPGPETVKPRSIFDKFLDPEPELPEPDTEVFDEYKDEKPYSFEIPEAEPYKSENQSLETITDEVSSSYFDKQYASRADMAYYDKREMAESTHNIAPLIDELSEEFDLRKAVIYSEILNPRYI